MSARTRIGWTAAALAALFAGMVAWALLAVERPESAALATHERASLALPFAPGDVVSLAITPRSGPGLQLERTPDGWGILTPAPGPAGTLAVEGFLDRLGAMRVRTSLPPGGAGLAALGLAPPASRITLTLRDGRTLSLDMGDESPFDRTRYCRVGGEIRVVEGVPAAAIDPVLEAFRSSPGAR